MALPARRRGSRWRYGRYDGTGAPIAFDASDVLSSLTDDLLYHGDLAAALRHLLREGFDSAAGSHVRGLEDMLRDLADRRAHAAAQQNDLAARVTEALDDVVATERSALAERTDEEALLASMQLELLPDDPVGKINQLMSYPFASAAARERFEELLDELRRELVQTQLDSAASALANATPEDQARLRDAIGALNDLLERRQRGEDVEEDFRAFQQTYGDLFPGDTLDEVAKNLAARMAAASAMFAAMSPDQRAQFDALSEQLLSDVDLAWQMDRLSRNLRDAAPDLDWDRPSGPPGDALSQLGGQQAIADLAEIGRLEEMLRGASSPDELREVDLDLAERHLGREARRSLEALRELTSRLEEAGLVSRRGGHLSLNPSGVRRLGANALDELFSRLRRDRVGSHATTSVGLGHDRAGETRPYEFGDPFRLDLQATLRNATVRQATEGRAEALPIRLALEDFEVEESEHLTNTSTVLAIDLSLSMPMEDNFLAAKKVAIALSALIRARYPRDYLGIIGFSATAHEIDPIELPEVSWDFAYGTNLQHALLMARTMLAKKSGSKQVIVITDGEPTAHIDDAGEVFFHYPAVPETVDRTLLEVARCTREHIVINTFVLGATGSLRSFVERMTRLNRGRAFYTTPDALGDYVLVDFVAHHDARTEKRIRPGA